MKLPDIVCDTWVSENLSFELFYLQLTPSNLHPGLSIQAFVDRLEGPSPQLDVKFEESSSWRCGDRFHLCLLLVLLAGSLDSSFPSISACKV